MESFSKNAIISIYLFDTVLISPSDVKRERRAVWIFLFASPLVAQSGKDLNPTWSDVTPMRFPITQANGSR